MSLSESFVSSALDAEGMLKETQAVNTDSFFKAVRSQLSINETGVYEQVKLFTALGILPIFSSADILTIANSHQGIDHTKILPIDPYQLSVDYLVVHRTGEESFKLLFIECDGEHFHSENAPNYTQTVISREMKKRILAMKNQPFEVISYDDNIGAKGIDHIIEMVKNL